jgi:DNA repair protein RecO (recombination protein O)
MYRALSPLPLRSQVLTYSYSSPRFLRASASPRQARFPALSGFDLLLLFSLRKLSRQSLFEHPTGRHPPAPTLSFPFHSATGSVAKASRCLRAPAPPRRIPRPLVWFRLVPVGKRKPRLSRSNPRTGQHPASAQSIPLFICATLKLPRVPARVSEALVLRTYPLKEADLVVSFFTRDQGKLRGVAKRARRPKSPFGAGLERLSHVRMAYFQRENRELVNLDSCELIRSQFGLASDYWASVALDYFAEVGELMLPAAEPSERVFRLLLAVLEHLRQTGESGAWRAVTYFSLWVLRLSGWLAELNVCLSCGALLDDEESPERAFFSRGRAGLMCGHCRRNLGAANSWELSGESRALAGEILRMPIAQLSKTGWGQSTAADLRRFLVQQIEAHVERRLVTAPLLEERAAGA